MAGGLFKRQVVLVTEKQNGSTGRRDVFEEVEQAAIRWLARVGTGGKGFRCGGLERLPAARTLQVGERNPRRNAESPGTENGRLAQKRELAEDLKRGLLEDVFGEVAAGKARDVAAQGRIADMEELLQGGAVSCLGEKNKQGLVGGRKLLRLG